VIQKGGVLFNPRIVAPCGKVGSKTVEGITHPTWLPSHGYDRN